MDEDAVFVEVEWRCRECDGCCVLLTLEIVFLCRLYSKEISSAGSEWSFASVSGTATSWLSSVGGLTSSSMASIATSTLMRMVVSFTPVIFRRDREWTAAFFVPGMCSTVNRNSCSRSRHRASLAGVLAGPNIHLSASLSVRRVKCVLSRYGLNIRTAQMIGSHSRSVLS